MTTIVGKQFQCPNCGCDTIREFCEPLVSWDIVRVTDTRKPESWPTGCNNRNLHCLRSQS